MGTNGSRGRADASDRSNSARGARSRGSRYPRLRPGPGLTAEDVAAHQRRRLQRAMIELVAARGYNDVSVTALAKHAGVSKRSFYQLFASKEECFLAAYDTIVGNSVRAILAAAEDGKEWQERLRLGFLSFADQIAERPEAARLALVEVFAAGAAAVERLLRTHRLFELLVAKNLGLASGPASLPPLVVKGIVAGCGRVARARLLAAQPRRLALDGGQLLDWSLSLCHEDVGRLRQLEPSPASPLPAQPAKLPLGDERAMILAATAKLATDGGYAALSAPRVCATAGVSRRNFNSHFDGVAECFLATLETLTGRTLASAEPSFLNAADPASGIHRMVVRLCRQLAGDPGFAGLAFLEVFSPRPEAIEWRSGMIARLAAMLRQGAPPGQRPTVFAAEASIGAMWGVIHHFVASGRTAQLPAAAPVLSYLALAPGFGGAAAIEAIECGSARG